ncbi:MAG: hypothetical protein KGS10_05635 [Chloroflexi bacterium]|nr:hypothetical protein [Chloroflexota bacterium]
MSDEHDTLFDPRLVLQVNRQPLQRPGAPHLVRASTVGGPDLPGDRRVYLSVDLLERCLAVAKTSPTGRAMLVHAGVRVDLYAEDGHTYEVWTLIGVGPKPEPAPAWMNALGVPR